jgi:hypothetical protein
LKNLGLKHCFLDEGIGYKKNFLSLITLPTKYNLVDKHSLLFRSIFITNQKEIECKRNKRFIFKKNSIIQIYKTLENYKLITILKKGRVFSKTEKTRTKELLQPFPKFLILG